SRTLTEPSDDGQGRAGRSVARSVGCRIQPGPPPGLIAWSAPGPWTPKMTELLLRLDAGCCGGIIRFMTDGFVLGPGDGERVSPAMTLKVGDKNSQTWSMFEVIEIGPGFDVGAHVHRNAEELFYVLEGQLDLLAFEPRVRTAGNW